MQTASLFFHTTLVGQSLYYCLKSFYEYASEFNHTILLTKFTIAVTCFQFSLANESRFISGSIDAKSVYVIFLHAVSLTGCILET